MSLNLAELRAIVGDAHVETDPARLEVYAADIAGAGFAPAALVAPENVTELTAVMREAAASGTYVIPRGGGMSYTGGYVATHADTLMLDLRRLDNITVHQQDRYVVAEAGATWGAIDAALAPHGLRLASFGPLSGFSATIGGGLSQHALFFGAAAAGFVGEAVLGLEVVLADGSVLGTGALARDGAPFLRQIAPDLTGIFLGDSGAFGVKTRAALRVITRPVAELYASFAFADVGAMVAAQAECAALGLATECYGFDEIANRHLAERGFGIAGSAVIAADLARASRSPIAAVRALFQAGAARFSHKDPELATLHVVVEAESEAAAAGRMATIRTSLGAREIADTIPRVTRSRPFRRIRALLGPAGQNWLPVHGIVPFSCASTTIAACVAFLAEHAGLFAHHCIEVTLLTSAGPGFILIEPQFFWFDSFSPMLLDAILPEQRSEHGARAADPEARAVVMQARTSLRDTLDAAGAVHIQPGKYYPLSLKSEAKTMLHRMKALFDPDNRMNPGALGLP
jgi:D-lactate dehydrogenase (cytochrome)